MIASAVPTHGTAVITYNIFLDRHERFNLIDLDHGMRYRWSPAQPTDERMIYDPQFRQIPHFER